MLYGMYISAAGALANSYRQDVIANNLANVETTAFKRDLALLQARPTQSAQTGQKRYTTEMLENLGGGTFAQPTYTDFTPASLTTTSRPYDLALAGKGFFQVLKDSDVLYTRDGRFSLNEQNQLVSYTDKLPLLDQAGKPIVLDPQIADFAVTLDGVVSQAGSPVARIGVVDFPDTAQLTKQGSNLYVSHGDQTPQPVDTPVQQNCLEASGVNPIDQLIEMIKTQRLFQTNVQMLQIQDQTLGSAISKLANIT